MISYVTRFSFFQTFIFLGVLGALFFCGNTLVSGQEVHQDLEETVYAEVLSIIKEEVRLVPGTDVETVVQIVRARALDGSLKGDIIEFENDYIQLEEGQHFYLNHLKFIDGGEMYRVRDVDRSRGLYTLGLFFVMAVLVFGGMQGVRSLLSLALSFVMIVFILFPLLLAGYSPILVSVVIGSLILCCAVMGTHGVSTRSYAACLGATVSVVITGVVAFWGIDLLHLSGFFSDETVYLNLNTGGLLDFKGLLLGGVIIGVLGVLDDIAVTQVAVVAELKNSLPHITNRELYTKALRVGKEHVSALVNTIVLAYAGVSLPLALLFSESEYSLSQILNNEIFATEIMRSIAGSIGLIATVPITTALAVWWAHSFGFEKSEHEHVHHHH
ncbi:YibE/F family protein [Patescibacteria group bacterium]|nr:YibE/F family protein [Patescibacteria group bacterium]